MRILVVLSETPETQGGGIATYLSHSRRALLEAGHEVFVLTWVWNDSDENIPDKDLEGVRIIHLQPKVIYRDYQSCPWSVAVSFALLPSILRAIDDFKPELIESSDYQGPLFGYLSHRRAGILKSSQTLPTVVYNHGLTGELYRANASVPAPWVHRELAAERTALRWCDICLVPSRAAMTKLTRQMGEMDNAAIVPEPFYMSANQIDAREFSNRFVHSGRISFAKGIDHVIHFLNVYQTLGEVDQIALVGLVENTTFKNCDGHNYVLSRLSETLRDKVVFYGRVPKKDISGLLSPSGVPGYLLNFSKQETFNYVFLEGIDRCLRPFTIGGTAMAEFYPHHLRNLLIPSDFDLSNLEKIAHVMNTRGSDITREIRQYSEQLTNPKRFVENYERQVNSLPFARMRRIKPIAVRKKFGPSDVTVVMATYNCGTTILEAVESVRRQTTPPRELIIFDDGSNDISSIERLTGISKLPGVRLLISPSNEGLCATRRKLIKAVETQLTIFLDDDDLLDEMYIEKTLAAFNGSEVSADAVITWRQNFGENNETVVTFNLDDGHKYLENDLRMTGLILTDALAVVNFKPAMRNGEADDWDFWLRFKQAGYCAVVLPEPLFRYRFRQGSMSWPWSQGQAALTSELVATRLYEAIEERRVAPDVILDLLTTVHFTAQKGVELGPQLSGWLERVKAVKLARERRPVLGGVLYFIFKFVSSAAKRIK